MRRCIQPKTGDMRRDKTKNGEEREILLQPGKPRQAANDSETSKKKHSPDASGGKGGVKGGKE